MNQHYLSWYWYKDDIGEQKKLRLHTLAPYSENYIHISPVQNHSSFTPYSHSSSAPDTTLLSPLPSLSSFPLPDPEPSLIDQAITTLSNNKLGTNQPRFKSTQAARKDSDTAFLWNLEFVWRWCMKACGDRQKKMNKWYEIKGRVMRLLRELDD